MQEHRRASPGATAVAVLLALLALLVVLTLRSPLDVIAALTSSRGTAPTVVDTVVASRTHDGMASVRDDGAGDAGAGASAVVDGPGTTGRWGEPAPRPTAALLLEELRGGWRVEGGIEEAAALAVIAAHDWADREGVGRRGSGGAGGAIVTVEAIERPGALHAVVTLLVAGADRLHRIAVPVRFDTEATALAGSPWELPSPPLRQEPLAGRAVGDPELIDAARRALEAVGVDGDRLRALEATDGWPFIARLDGDDDAHPWLRWHVDRFVMTGLPLDAVREHHTQRD